MMVAVLKFVTVFIFLAFLAFSNYRTNTGYIFGHFSTGFYSFYQLGKNF
jgi:hypothetical protein